MHLLVLLTPTSVMEQNIADASASFSHLLLMQWKQNLADASTSFAHPY